MCRPGFSNHCPFFGERGLDSSILGHDVCLEKSSMQSSKQNRTKSHNASRAMASPSGLLDPSGSKSMKQEEENDLELSLADFVGELHRYHDEWPHDDCKSKSELCPELKTLIHTKLNELKSAPCELAYEEAPDRGQKETFNEKHLCGSRPYQNKLIDEPGMLSPEKELFLKTLQNPSLHALEKESTQRNQNRQVVTKLDPRKMVEKGENTKNSKQQEVAVKTHGKEGRHIFFSKSLIGMLSLPQCNASSPRSSPRVKDCIDLSPEETNISAIHKADREQAGMLLSYPENAVDSLEQQEPKTPRSSPSLQLISQISPEGNHEKQEQPSPVSVLDPFFHEDVDSPDHETMIKRKLHQDMTMAHTPDVISDQGVFWEDEDARIGYIKAMLELSELYTCQNLEVWYLEDELISPCLVEELHQGNQADDLKLPFDCTCEAITVIQETYFRNPPCLSFLRHKIQPPPMGENLIQEINKHIERHLHNQFPRTLNQLVNIDLEDGTWMNLQLESEEIVVDTWEFILDELLEEVANDLLI